MTTYRGNAGVLKVATYAVAELTGFTIQTTIGMLDDTAQGDAARTHKSDELPDFSGSMRGWYDPSDTNGQAAVVEGAALAFEGSPIGTANGLAKLTGDIIVSGVTITSDNGSIVTFEANFQGTGGLTRGTHSA
ncbi:MAG: hypothetical protein KIT02_10300 [Devosia sp.]|uniref:hypothetical protein n=1 Tax=Devosia sp. TaxID=1871048 RepID=UPI0024C86883|nr:hypothetical protein [Devosia sp.]UYN98357.1 MAG: hypothetical protein KIT02_10300 [Devosia sp.]